jgi:hypothetical protein
VLVAAPIWVGYEVLAARGQAVVAHVTRVTPEPDGRGGTGYAVWLTDQEGHPIAQPLLTYGPPQPLEVGDTIRVVADPRGEADTQPADRNMAPWLLAGMIVGVVLVPGGLAVAAREPRPRAVGGSRRGLAGRTGWPVSAPPRRVRRRQHRH